MLILASNSASRKKILSDLGYDFQVIPSDAEEFFQESLSAEENAMHLALAKAQAVAKTNPNALVIGCDTIQINPSGKLLEKPKDRADAYIMMKNRSGKTERLVSGIAFIKGDFVYTGFEESMLHWKEMTEEEINWVLDTGEWEGKCGGIAIEGVSGFFITRLEGSIANVMGFPLSVFWETIPRIS